MTRPQLGSIAIAVYLVATPATAAEFKRTPQADGPDIISISGVIEQNDDKKFVELTWGVKDAIVVLNSRGGYISAATNIGLRVRSHNYETRVHSDAICNSACTLIWLAGTYRHMDPKTRLGFHSAREKRNTHARFEAGNRKIAEYLTKLGIPQQVIDLQPKADPCCFNYVGHAQAKALGLLNDRSAKQQQTLPTPETQQQATTAPSSPKPVIPFPESPANSGRANGAGVKKQMMQISKTGNWNTCQTKHNEGQNEQIPAYTMCIRTNRSHLHRSSRYYLHFDRLLGNWKENHPARRRL